jgi:hypothetical protein
MRMAIGTPCIATDCYMGGLFSTMRVHAKKRILHLTLGVVHFSLLVFFDDALFIPTASPSD